MAAFNVKKYVLTIIVLNVLLIIPMSAVAFEDAHSIKEGEKHVHGAHNECSLPKITSDIVECALQFHPSVRRGLLNLNSATKLDEKASQIPNPTFSSRFVKGDKDGVEISELEANLAFTVEMGGKRGARKEHALASKNKVLALNEITKSEIKIETILNLYRLRQVLSEKQIVEQTIKAFSRVITKLKKLPKLSAELEASLTLFEIVLEEMRVNESEFFEEERKLEHYFHISTGHSLAEIKNVLPAPVKMWPQINSQLTDASSPEVIKLKALSLLAQKEFEIQKSQAWSDLKVGPSLAIEEDGGVQNQMVGLNIQIPIPLFQVNGGGKAYAQSEFIKAQRNVSLTQTEEKHERFEQLRIYESAVNILSKTMKQSTIEKKHNRIESLYLRGVVSSSVFIDSLKQKLSYLRIRNRRELTAIKALWNIYKYDGKIFEEKI